APPGQGKNHPSWFFLGPQKDCARAGLLLGFGRYGRRQQNDAVSRDPLAYPEPLIRRVYAYVAYRIGDGADAEDVTSEVFERALRYRKSYDRRKGEPAAWLIGIARRSVDSHLAGRPPVAGEVPDTPAPGDLEE